MLFSQQTLLLVVLVAISVAAAAASSYERPSYISHAIEKDLVVHYFGVGSNMLREKVTNRGLNGTSISIRSMKAGEAKGYRLAFNMRGFPPIEPSMAGIEPCVEDASCHGALIEMEAKEYQKIWLSEGGAFENPGYNEVVLDVYPYGHSKPVKAVALRAANHTRMQRDGPPSSRYMDILLRGAKELNLDPSYVDHLMKIPLANPSRWLTLLTMKHLLCTTWLYRIKLRFISRFISRLLWLCFVPAESPLPLKILSEIGMALVLLPGALTGLLIQLSYKIKGVEPPKLGFLSAKPKNNSTTTTK